MFPERNGTRGPTRGRGSKPNAGRNQAKRHPARPRIAEQIQDLPLVEGDGLRFRVRPGGLDDLPGPSFDTAAIAGTFRSAFAVVWGRIPPADRRRLTSYWLLDRDNLAIRARIPHPQPAPLIQIVTRPDVAEVELTSFGCVITFPASLVVALPDRLEREIARALAGVHLLATRVHWRLNQEMLDEPMAAWESGVGLRATDAQRRKKIERLEEAHLAAYKAQVARTIAGWGIKAA